MELEKAGYTDTLLIEVTGTSKAESGQQLTAIIKLTIRLENIANYKKTETAYIVDVTGASPDVDVYIVGSKMYFDQYTADVDDFTTHITFGDEKHNPFDVVAWIYDEPEFSLVGEIEEYNGVKLSNSSEATIRFRMRDIQEEPRLTFRLETETTLYETKEYQVVYRDMIGESPNDYRDPKGIYFEKTSATIKIGEEYTPVVWGVATGEPVDATINIPNTGSNRLVVDLMNEKTIVGTAEGVTYITATYDYMDGISYKSNSMKIIVESSKPEPSVRTGYITLSDPTSKVNVRKGPGTSYAVAGFLKHGTAVQVVGFSGDWCKLSNGYYVNSAYVRFA